MIFMMIIMIIFSHLLCHRFASLFLPEPTNFLLVIAPRDRLIAKDVNALGVRVFDVLERERGTCGGGDTLAEHGGNKQEQKHPDGGICVLGHIRTILFLAGRFWRLYLLHILSHFHVRYFNTFLTPLPSSIDSPVQRSVESWVLAMGSGVRPLK